MAKLTTQQKLFNLNSSALDVFGQGIAKKVVLSPGRVQVFTINELVLFDVRDDGTIAGIVIGRKARVGTDITEQFQAELRRLAEKYHKEIITKP